MHYRGVTLRCVAPRVVGDMRGVWLSSPAVVSMSATQPVYWHSVSSCLLCREDLSLSV